MTNVPTRKRLVLQFGLVALGWLVGEVRFAFAVVWAVRDGRDVR